MRRGPSQVPVQIVTALIFVTAFSISHDFNPRHLWRIGTPEATFRLDRFERYAATWYPRHDFAGPAEYVNTRGADGTPPPVIVFGQPPVSYYLNYPHAVFYARDDRRFRRVSREKGTVDLWSNQRLLSSPAEIAAYCRETSVVWAILGVEDREKVAALMRATGREILEDARVAEGEDGRLEVRRIRLAAPSG